MYTYEAAMFSLLASSAQLVARLHAEFDVMDIIPVLGRQQCCERKYCSQAPSSASVEILTQPLADKLLRRATVRGRPRPQLLCDVTFQSTKSTKPLPQ